MVLLTDELKQTAKKFIDCYMPFEKIKNYPSQWGGQTRNPNYTGLLGEIVVNMIQGNDIRDVLTRRAKYGADKGFDIVIDGKTWDIKTKTSSYRPRPYYLYDVEDKHLNKIQNHGFIFNFMMVDESEIIPVGFITKEEFMQKSILRRKGDVSPESGLVYRANSYHIKITELKDIDLLLKKEDNVDNIIRFI